MPRPPSFCPATWRATGYDCAGGNVHVCAGGRQHNGDHRCECGAVRNALAGSQRPSRAAAALRAKELECEDTIVAAAMRFGWQVHAERAARTARGKVLTAIKGQAGYPDLTLVRSTPGGTLFVELKRWPHEVEDAQHTWHRRLRSAGNTVVVLWVPEELDRFVGYLAGTRPPWWPQDGRRASDTEGIRP